MVGTRTTTVLTSLLCLALALSGCTQTPEDGGAGRDDRSDDPADVAVGQEEPRIVTKPPLRIDMRLNGTTEDTYTTRIDGRDLVVLDTGNRSVLHYDLHMWFGALPTPTDVTVSWHFDEERPVDAEVVGTHTLQVAPVDTSAVLPVSVLPGDGAPGGETRLFASIETEPEVGGAATSVIGIAFK